MIMSLSNELEQNVIQPTNVFALVFLVMGQLLSKYQAILFASERVGYIYFTDKYTRNFALGKH